MSVTRFSLYILALLGLIFIPGPGRGVASASERETELFNKGYEYLFSFKPDKAAETFRIFLQEFPGSSARDAALFWLGKTLISTKSYSEAEQTFQMIQTEFPDSPFIVFIDTEMEEIAKIRSTGAAQDIKETPEPQKAAVSKEVGNGIEGEPLRLRLAQLERISEEQGRELTMARQEQEKLNKLLLEEKRHAAELRADLTRSKERGQGVTAPSPEKDPEQLTAEVREFKARVSELQAENAKFTDRVEELELQAEQRLRDMRIMNAYLSRLMFQKKETPKPKSDSKAAEERDQPAVSQTAPGPVVRIKNRDYPLAQIIAHQTTAALLYRILGANEPVWRAGDPLNDFIAEELLLQEASRADIKIDQKKQKEVTVRHKLSPAEVDYLGKFMTIAQYLDSRYLEAPSQHWVEVLTGDYKPGDAASKTVLATSIQKAAREGSSYEDISRIYSDAVRFLRLTIEEFRTKYRDKSQIIEKLNFQNEETVVIWSDKGYMLIKPVIVRIPYNPFIEMKTDEKLKIRSFALKHIDELKKKN